MRLAISLIALACLVESAIAQLPVTGDSRVEQFAVADGLRIVEHQRLRTRGAGLRFTESGASPFPFVELASRDCSVRLEDRSGDGAVDTVRAEHQGRATGSCPAVEAPFEVDVIESGALAGPLKDCLLSTTKTYDVVCQPTRFGRAEGAPWTVVSGWVDRFGRDALGRPSSLFWDGNLLILDGPSGVIYRVEPHVEVEAVETPVSYLEVKPKKPVLPRRSKLLTGEETISKERQKILDDRAQSSGGLSNLRNRLRSPPPDSEAGN